VGCTANVGALNGINIGFATDADTGDFVSGGLTVSTLNFVDDIKTASFTGGEDNSVHIIATAGAGELTDTLDLSNFEGYFQMDNTAGINGDVHTILVGNLGTDNLGTVSNINVQSGSDMADFAGSAQTYVFGSELDHGVSITGFDGVNNNAAGDAAGLNADVLDLSALGVTALSQLSITDDGTDTTIASNTDAFDGHITLVGITAADLTAADFHFA
jgi:hypothetical protein